jgi:ureidoacrylate peracid hydrolase
MGSYEIADWVAVPHREVLRSLEAKAQPRHTALLVIDMLNDFCAEGGMMWHEGLDVTPVQEMAERLPRLLEAARSAGVLVVFVRNLYSTDENWYLSDVWLEQASRRRSDSYTKRAVCEPGSWNANFYGEVRPRDDEPIVTKHRFSAFLNTDLDLVLRSHGIRTLVMTGTATNVCVETTAREGFMRDYYILFVEDGTATYAEEDHQATLRTIDRFFGQVVSMDQLIELWRGRQEDETLASKAGTEGVTAVGPSRSSGIERNQPG